MKRLGRPSCLVAVGLSMLVPATAAGQSSSAASHNRGALTFSGGVDAPSVYFFRGIRQEREPKITVAPFGEIRIALSSADAGGRALAVTLGVWNSLQTGSSGLEGPSGRLHYEEDFYAALALGIGKGIEIETTFTAYTSPNAIFNTRKEVSLEVSKEHWLKPAGLLAVELGDTGQADHGRRKGTYLELGAAPTWALMAGGPTVQFPVKVGLSLKDYYEGRNGDDRFGFFDVGGLFTLPLKVPERFGSWDAHAGANWLLLGDSTKAVNIDKDGNITGREILWTVGVGVIY